MDLVRRSTGYLAERGIANARREAEWIFAESLGLTRLDLYTRFDMPLEASDVDRLRALVARRGRREPLAYVLGTQDFGGLRLRVGPGVLVPRPETEELVERILAALPATQLRALDIGSGSGAIALALKRARPAWTMEATDVSAEALAIARDNARRNDLEVVFHHGHLATHLGSGWRLVVANLPYVGTDERAACDPELAHEPEHALYAGADGLELIAQAIDDAPRLLADDGELWLEHGSTQAAAIAARCAARSLTCTSLRDGAGKDRFARITRR